MAAAVQQGFFKGRHVASEVVLWALRWHLASPISHRDLAAMLWDRGVSAKSKVCAGVEHATLFRWVQAHAAEQEQRIRRCLRPSTGSWRVNETHAKVKGAWADLCRAADSLGQTIGVLLSAQRDAASAKRFFRKALAQLHTVNPRTITVNENPAYPAANPAGVRERAVADMKRAGEPWRFAKRRPALTVAQQA